MGLGFDHVYDDHATIVSSAAARMSVAQILGACLRGTHAFPDVSRPAMVLSVRLDHALSGARPLGTHATSLALYVAATFAAYALARVILRRRALAVAAAALWASMPVHAEVVVCASYREDLLAAIGVFGALALVLAPTRAPLGWPRAACAASLAALGLAGKESAVVIVPLLAALAPFSTQEGFAGIVRWVHARERALGALALVGIAYGAWRLELARVGDGVARAASHGPHDDARYLVWAAARSFWPVEVAPIYADEAPASAAWWIPALALIAVWARLRTRVIGRAIALVVFGALVTAPFVGPANERADRYLLFTTLGAACLAVLACRAIARRLRAPSAAKTVLPTLALALALTLVLGTRSAFAALPWSSDLALWSYATERVPESAKAWQARAWAERRAGRLDDAARSLAQSLAIDPTRPETLLSSAYLALARGDVPGAQRTLDALRAEGHERLPGFTRASRCTRATDPARCVDEGLR